MDPSPQISPSEGSFIDVNVEKGSEPTTESQIDATFQRLKAVLDEERTLRQRLEDLFQKQQLLAEEELKRAKENLNHINSEQLRMRDELVMQKVSSSMEYKLCC
jgi:erythromycin esterase-like protein